ncbi:MAG: ArsA family ATPase [Thermodesulfobacteriota bacterium]
MLETIGKPGGPGIVVCCGSGGVGKTTVSAAIGLCGALAGLNTVVLTIDPARRLADSLGIGEFQEEAQRVPLEQYIEAPGQLHAMMLDAKRTFDRLILRYAPPSMQPRIFSNRYYQHLSNNMAGSHEYMAMERLYEIYHQGDYDFIVLDTPPSRRALDFLEAPQRMLNVLGHQFFIKLFKPYMSAGRFGLKVFNLVAAPVFKAISQIVGNQAMEDLFAFFRLWNDVLFEGFRQRARAVEKLLADPKTAFLAVTTPQAPPMDEALYLYHQLVKRQMPFAGFIVNRVHDIESRPSAGNLFDELSAIDGEVFDPEMIEKLRVAYERLGRLSQNDAAAIAELKAGLPPEIGVRQVPFADTEVTDIASLKKICDFLST